MEERNVIPVDEEYLQQIIAGQVPLHREKHSSSEKPETQRKPEVQEIPKDQVEPVEMSEPVKKIKERKRGSTERSDFTELFLKENRLSDRRMVYVSKETYEKLIKYVSVISDRKLSVAGYLDNMVSHHIENYEHIINELYESRIGCKLFKN